MQIPPQVTLLFISSCVFHLRVPELTVCAHIPRVELVVQIHSVCLPLMHAALGIAAVPGVMTEPFCCVCMMHKHVYDTF
jgi:hypothetical protein